MYTRGATSVSCGACHVVTNTAGIAAEGGGVNSTASKSSVGEEERELVVVENPPTLDAKGVARSNMAVGLVCED